KVSLPELAERGAAEARHPALVEELVRQRLAAMARADDVREHVERARRPRTGESGYRAHSVHDRVAPAPELRAHRVHRGLIAPQGLDGGELAERGRARRRVG